MSTAENIEIVDEENEVLVLGTNERLIREVGEKTKGLVISDSKTFESVKKARTEMVTVRTSIDKARKTANQTHRDAIADNDTQAKALTVIASEYEEPLQGQVKKWEDQKAEEKRIKEEAEQARKAVHISAIDTIRNLPVTHVNASIEELQGVIDHYTALVITEEVFEEYAIEAQQALKSSLANLDTMITNARDQAAEAERQKAEQRRLDEEQKKLDEQREQQEAKAREEQKKLDEQREEQEAEARERKEEQDAEEKRLEKKRKDLEKCQREADERAESERQEREANAKREQEEQERQQREEALRPDKEKLVAFASQIRELNGPEVASDEAALIIECALRELAGTANIISQQCEAL